MAIINVCQILFNYFQIESTQSLHKCASLTKVSDKIYMLEDKFKVFVQGFARCTLHSANEIIVLIMWSATKFCHQTHIKSHVRGPTLNSHGTCLHRSFFIWSASPERPIHTIGNALIPSQTYPRIYNKLCMACHGSQRVTTIFWSIPV